MLGEGGNNSNSHNMIKRRYRMCENDRRHSERVILDCMCEDYLFWPKDAEQRQIESQARHTHRCINCTGYSDRSISPSDLNPELVIEEIIMEGS